MATDIRYIGEAVVDYLSSYRVEHVFGIPGTHSIELYRGLEKSTVQHVLTRHEQGAGFMADGYARQSGKPGVCFVITGPGATNALTAMAQAHSDSIPLLIFSPVNDTLDNFYNAGRLHEIGDQAAVFKPVTAFSQIAQSETMLRELIDRAFEMFEMRRPRPAHIHIPLSLLRSKSMQEWQRPIRVAEQAVDKDNILDALTAIEQASAPIIVAGGGCRGFGAGVISLAERIACPVLTTVAGRGVVPASHALSVGAQIASEPVQQLLASADLVLVLGSELAEPDHWTEHLTLPEIQIWVNLDAQLLNYRSPTIAIQSAVGSVLAELNTRLDYANKQRTREQYALCKQVREQHGNCFTAMKKYIGVC